jgi:hypothetical protein
MVWQKVGEKNNSEGAKSMYVCACTASIAKREPNIKHHAISRDFSPPSSVSSKMARRRQYDEYPTPERETMTVEEVQNKQTFWCITAAEPVRHGTLYTDCAHHANISIPLKRTSL